MKRIEDMTLAEMAAEYNKHAETPVKKFSDKKSAMRRLQEVLPKKGRKLLKIPAKGEQRPPKKGSNAELFIQLLSRKNGASIQEISEAGKVRLGRTWKNTSIRTGLHGIIAARGYPVEEFEPGRFRITA